MAYTDIDITKPDASTQSISDFAQSTRDNVEGLFDLLVGAMLSGAPIVGWTMAVTSGTYALPTQLTYTSYYSANKKVRVNITYDGSDRRATVTMEKTSDGGSNWYYVDYAGANKLTYAYDGTSTNLTSITAGTA